MPLHDLIVGALALAGLGALAYLLWHVEAAWIVAAGLVLTVFAGHWPDIGTSLPVDRLVLAAGVLAAILRWATSASGPPLRLRTVHWLLLFTAGYAVISGLAAHSLPRGQAVFLLLDKLGIMPWILFLVAPFTFRTAHQRNILLGALVILGAYLSFTSFAEGAGLNAVIFPRYILDPNLGIHQDLARGPFLEATENGIGLFVGGVAAAIGAVTWSARWARRVAIAVASLCGGAILFTFERSVWLGTVLGLVVAVAAFREMRRPLTAGLATAGAVIILGALAASPAVLAHAKTRAADQSSIYERNNLNNAALRMIKARPLFGFGWDQFQANSPAYFRLSPNYPLTVETALDIPEHNVFLSNAVELGLVGVTIWFVGLCLGVGGAIVMPGPSELRVWRMGLAALATQWVVIANFTPLSGAFSHLMLWTCAGVATSRGQVPREAVSWTSESFKLESFERLTALVDSSLLRVAWRWHGQNPGVTAVRLLVTRNGQTHRLAPLPGPNDGRPVDTVAGPLLRAGFRLPADLPADADSGFALQLAEGLVVTLPLPAALQIAT